MTQLNYILDKMEKMVVAHVGLELDVLVCLVDLYQVQELVAPFRL